MLIIDVTFNVLRSMRPGAARFFFMEKGNSIEVYLPFSGMLFRSVYQKQDEEKDMIFAANWLADSIQITGYTDTASSGLDKIMEVLEEK